MGGEADMDWQILKGQIEDAAKNLGYSDKELAIFHLYYYQGWTADQISKLPGESGAAGPLDSTPILPRPPGGLSVKGVESLIHRMTKDLRNFFGDDEGP